MFMSCGTVGGFGFGPSIGTILVLFILLVIILRCTSCFI
ncbi:YjcZ family sporulation protein [Paenibacillus sp. N3/727]|nr:YjcZ family sporulation protein [Paenibacillus sp. N3/727]UNK17075.1 YjcZ family sporulation protein [Paenibacillus sp. N3/727]